MKRRGISSISTGGKKPRGEDCNTLRTSQTSSTYAHPPDAGASQIASSPTRATPVDDNAGARTPIPSRPTGEPAPEITRTLNAAEQVQLQILKGDINKAQETIQFLLKANQAALRKNEEPLPHCNPRLVKKISNAVINHLLLEEEVLYPTEKMQQDALLREFGISADDKKSYDEFLRAWHDSTCEMNLKTVMKDALRRRKGSLTKNLRDELYSQLGVRKYHRGASLDERVSFNEELEKHKVNDQWRTSEENGCWDPWGSQPVHAAISKAIYGAHYNPEEEITLSVEMASFYLHVLTLAMEDRNLQGNERLTLEGELKEMEKKIVDWHPFMRRLIITFPA